MNRSKQFEMLQLADGIREYYGVAHQLNKLVEEMSELTREIMKYNNDGKDNVDSMLSEMADVNVLMMQLEIALDTGAYSIDERMIDKIDREVKRIQDKKQELDETINLDEIDDLVDVGEE